FTTNIFVSIAYTLAFVGLWRTEGADLRGHLAEQLLVSRLEHDFGLGRGFGADTCGQLILNGVRKPQGQIDLVPLGVGPVTDANQLQLSLKTIGNTAHHVVYQGTIGA